MANSGYKSWATLEQYNVATGQATGVTKPNTAGDPDYVAPVYDISACPVVLTLTINPSSVSISSSAQSIVIAVTSNTSWIVANLPTGITDMGLGDGSGSGNSTVSISANTGGSSRSLSYTIRTSDGSIIRTVNVTQAAAPVSQTTYEIQLAFSNSGQNACNDYNNTGFLGLYYADTQFFGEATKLWSNSAGTTNAPAGWYSDGSTWLYFNGTSVIDQGFCGF